MNSRSCGTLRQEEDVAALAAQKRKLGIARGVRVLCELPRCKAYTSLIIQRPGLPTNGKRPLLVFQLSIHNGPWLISVRSARTEIQNHCKKNA